MIRNFQKIAALLFAFIVNYPAFAVVVSDGDFSSWTPFFFRTDDPTVTGSPPNLSTGSAVRLATGGNPDAYFEATHTIHYGDTAWTGGIKSDFSYNPAVDGEIGTLSVSADLKHLSGQSAWQLVVEQAGQRYYSVPLGAFTATSWANVSTSALTANDFDTNPWAGYAGVIPDGNQPDFSAVGASIKFGFMFGNAVTGGTITNVLGLDNFTVAIAPSTTVGPWIDDFESYLPGTFPNTSWANSGGTAVTIDQTASISGIQSLKLFGQLGGCWGSVASRALDVAPPFEISFNVRNGTELLSGCHPSYGGVNLAQTSNYGSAGRGLIAFTKDGEIRAQSLEDFYYYGTYSDTLLGAFNPLEWNNVRIRYEIVDPANIKLTYWINGVQKAAEVRPAETFESSLAYLEVWSGEGTAWFDDIQVHDGQVTGITSLSLANIPDTSVNTSVPIQIEAVDATGSRATSINGTVVLSTSPNVQIDPTQLDMAAGLASGNVTFKGGAVPMTLAASIEGMTGISNPFTVINPAAMPSSLTVSVDDNGTSLGFLSATVHLIDNNGNEVTEVAYGYSSAEFTGLTAGSYELWAELNQNTDVRSSTGYKYILGESKHETTTLSMTDTSKTPVLVVPGMMGSTSSDPLNMYPRLPASFAKADELKIFQGTFDAVGLYALMDALASANYAVHPTPWDWRWTLDDTSGVQTAWEINLMDKIDQAKDPNNDGIPDFNKVHVVAHSMGGLLTRAYIQSSRYRNDIDKFVMLGTPNEGSTKAYYLAHGGDPLTADGLGLVDVYENATKYLMKHHGQEIYEIRKECPPPVLTGPCKTVKVLRQDAIRAFYAKNVPTGRQLLPTYPFLDKPAGPGPEALSLEANDLLVRLNNDLTVQTKMINGNADVSATPDKVRTIAFVSNEEDTDNTLGVNTPSPTDAIYPEGSPREAANQTPGDGTVTQDSASNSSNACISGGGSQLTCWMAVQVCSAGKHPKMFGKFALQVRDYLNGDTYGCPP